MAFAHSSRRTSTGGGGGNGLELLAALPEDSTRIDLNDSTGVNQAALQFVVDHFPNLEFLCIHRSIGSGVVGDEVLAFDRTLNFPRLKTLEVNAHMWARFHLDETNAPCLEKLNLTYVQLLEFNLRLLTLKALTGSYVDVDQRCARHFAPSVSKCTALENVIFYKLLGLGRVGSKKMYLPSCECLSLHRSDDLDVVDLYLPQVRVISLQACYSLEHVRLVDEPILDSQFRCFVCQVLVERQMGQPRVLLPCSECGLKLYCSNECKNVQDQPFHSCKKSIRISMLNVNVDEVSLTHLINHPRVDEIIMPDDDETIEEEEIREFIFSRLVYLTTFY